MNGVVLGGVLLLASLVATSSHAGSSKYSASIATPPPVCQAYACEAGLCEDNGSTSCTTNADCAICGNLTTVRRACAADSECVNGSVSPKSRYILDADGTLTVSIQGLVDVAGQPVTTDGVVGSDDDYVLVLSALTMSTTTSASIKLEVTQGKASLELDDPLAYAVSAPRTTALTIAQLFSAPTVPADCPGDNSPSAVQARTGDTDCVTGRQIALSGVLMP